MRAPPAGPPPASPPRPTRAFALHRLAFVLVNGALTAVNIAAGPPWWAFWPLAAWGLVLTVHFLIHRASTVDEAWVDARANDLRERSYDQGHIDDIHAQPAPSIRDRLEPPSREPPP